MAKSLNVETLHHMNIIHSNFCSLDGDESFNRSIALIPYQHTDTPIRKTGSIVLIYNCLVCASYLKKTENHKISRLISAAVREYCIFLTV